MKITPILSSVANDYLVEMLANCSQDLVVIADWKRTIVFVNRSLCQKTGYRVKELVGAKTPLLYHRADRPKYTAKIYRALHECGQWNGEIELRKKNGESLFTCATVFALYDDEGKPAGTVGVGRDVSERRLREQHLWKSEGRLQLVIEAMEDAVCVTDLKGRIVMCNRAQSELAGIRKEEIVGMQPPYPWVAQGDAAKLRRGFKIVLKEGRLRNYTIAWMRRDQSRIAVSLSISRLRGSPKIPHGFVVSARDVSEVRYTDELRRFSERLQRLTLDVKRKAQRLQTLQEVNLLVLKNAKTEQIFKSITSGIGRLVEHDLAGMYVYDHERGVLFPHAISKQTSFSRELARFPLTLGKGIIGEAALAGKMVMVNNAQRDPRSRYPENMRPEKEHFIAVPLKGRGVLFGVLVVSRNRDPEFIEEEALLVKSFAEAATVALENVRLYSELEQYQEKALSVHPGRKNPLKRSR